MEPKVQVFHFEDGGVVIYTENPKLDEPMFIGKTKIITSRPKLTYEERYEAIKNLRDELGLIAQEILPHMLEEKIQKSIEANKPDKLN